MRFVVGFGRYRCRVDVARGEIDGPISGDAVFFVIGVVAVSGVFCGDCAGVCCRGVV